MCFLISQKICDSVATSIHSLIVVGAADKQFCCCRNNTWVLILVSFSTGIQSKLHKYIETFNPNMFHGALIFLETSPKSN